MYDGSVVLFCGYLVASFCYWFIAYFSEIVKHYFSIQYIPSINMLRLNMYILIKIWFVLVSVYTNVPIFPFQLNTLNGYFCILYFAYHSLLGLLREDLLYWNEIRLIHWHAWFVLISKQVTFSSIFSFVCLFSVNYIAQVLSHQRCRIVSFPSYL